MRTLPAPAHLDSRSALTEIALQLGTSRDVDHLAAKIVDLLVRLLRADRALFALFDEGGEIDHVVHHGLEDWPGLPAPLPIAHSIIADAVATRDLVVESTHDDDASLSRRSARLLDLRFLFAVPLEVGEQVVGVLYVDSRQSALRDVEDIEGTLIALARLVGTAVDNARLWEEAEFRNLLLGQLVHDLALPVSAVQLNSGHLLRGPATPTEVAEIAVDISAASARMAEMIATTLDLCRAGPGRRSVPPATVADLPTVLAQQLETLDDVRRSAGLTFALETAPGLSHLLTFPDRLRSIVSNLVFNAVKFAPVGSVIRVEATISGDRGPEARLPGTPAVYLFRRAPCLRPAPGTAFAAIRVTNRGTPIPAELLPRLFRPWTRGPAPTRPGRAAATSSGLGLAIVEQCVRSLGGRVWVESTAESGTSFTFTLPLDAVEA